MPYENEDSSLIASANFNNNILSEKEFHSKFLFENKNKQQILLGLKHLLSVNKIDANIDSKQSNIYDNLYCIDGSLIAIKDDYGGEYINMQFGSALLNVDKLFNIRRDNKGNINPYDVANLYGNEDNILLGTKFPSKNVFFNKGGKFLSLKESFVETMDYLFNGKAQPIVKSFMDDLHNINKFSNANSLNGIDNIQKILSDIRDESAIYSTEKESQKIMLLSETILSQYLLKKNTSGKNLILLDGRLHNQDIGEYIREINKFKITDNSMLIGVQKTGLLNKLLSTIHEILKADKIDLEFKELHKKYKEGHSIFFILDNDFKKICGLPNFDDGKYGRECFYITEEPKRKEFVFTLPDYLFKKSKNDNSETKNREEIIRNTIPKLSSVFEYAHTDLYMGNKGVLLANVLAHNNVSLNKKYTSVLATVSNNEVNLVKKNKI